MKKIFYTACIILLLIAINKLYQSYDYSKEVSSINTDIITDYEDIIIKEGNQYDKVVALTFDDGPDEDFTPQVLDVLKKYNVKATFFVVGQKVGWHPQIVKRQYEEGHELGNHTFTHINVSKSSYKDIEKEIIDTQNIIKDTVGEEPKTFRPPYRAISKEMCSIIKSNHMDIVLWSNLDPRDWSNPGVYNIVESITSNVQNGNIILLHDYNNLRNDKSQTIQALDIVIPKLKSMGYKFVTVSELINNLDNSKPTEK